MICFFVSHQFVRRYTYISILYYGEFRTLTIQLILLSLLSKQILLCFISFHELLYYGLTFYPHRLPCFVFSLIIKLECGRFQKMCDILPSLVSTGCTIQQEIKWLRLDAAHDNLSLMDRVHYKNRKTGLTKDTSDKYKLWICLLLFLGSVQ